MAPQEAPVGGNCVAPGSSVAPRSRADVSQAGLHVAGRRSVPGRVDRADRADRRQALPGVAAVLLEVLADQRLQQRVLVAG